MALPSTPNTLHFGGLADNNESASKDSISLQTYSRLFASGSSVGNVDGSGAADTIADRNQLNTAPYAMSEFYDAHIPNAEFGSVVAKLTDGTAVTSNGFVDGEAGRIYWTITTDPAGSTTYTGGLKYKSDASIAVSSTLAYDGTGTKYVSITAPSTTQQIGSPYRYYSFVSTDIFKNSVGADLSHYDQLSGGAVNASDNSHTLDASSETNSLTIGPTVSVGTQTGYSTSTSVVTVGDNQAISIAGANVTMTGAGVTQITATHIGNPSQARNSTTSTENITVTYNRAIESLTLATSATVNYGADNVTISAISEGVQQNNFHVGYDDNNTTSDVTFTSLYTNVTSLYVRTTVSKDFTVPAGSYFIKAKHTGDGTAVVGASFIVAPTFVYTTIGNSSNISVNGTSHTFRVTSATGNNVVITITNNLNASSTTDYGTGYSLSPGTADGIYTVTYTGTANYSQTNNQTDTVNCYPDANYSVTDSTLLINAPAGSGLSNDSLAVTSTSVGSNISAYAYAITKDGDAELEETFTTANFTVSSADVTSEYGVGTFNIELVVTGGGGLQNTETGDNDFTIANHPAQALTVTAPTSVHVARRGTSSAIAWTKTSAAAVTIKSYKNAVLVDTLSSGNTGLSHTWTPDGGDALGTDWTIYGSVDSGTATDHSSQFTLKDGIATSPDLNSAVAGNGEATISWTDGSYNGGGNYVYIYTGAGVYIATSTQAGTSYAYPSDTNSKHTVKFKVSGINLSSEEGDKSDFSNAVIIYPDLTGHNDIVCSGTVYSTTRNSTGTTKVISVTDTTDNVTSYTYSVTSGGGSISSATGTTTINDATYQAAGAGSVVLRLTVNGDLSQTGDYSEATITSILYPKIYNAATGVGGGTIYANGSFNVYWQGFTLNADTDSLTFKLYNSSNVQQGSTVTKLGDEAEFTSAGSTTSTGQYSISSFGSVSTNHGVSSAGDYYYVVEAFDEGSTKGRYTTSTFSVTVPTNTDLNCETEEGEFVGGYATLIAAADTTPDFVNGTVSVWFNGLSLSGNTFYTNNTLTTPFNGDGDYFSRGGDVFQIETNGAVDELDSRTPDTLSTPTLSVDDDIDLTVPSSNTMVARSIRVHSSVAINGTQTATWTVTQSTTYSTTKSMATLYGATLAVGQAYTFKVQGFNNDGYTGTYSGTVTGTTDASGATWSTVPTDFPLEAGDPGLGSATVTSLNKTYVLTDGSGSTTFYMVRVSGTAMYEVDFAVGTSSSPTNWTNTGGTITIASPTNPESYYFRVRHDWRENLEGESGVYRVTATNDGVANSALDITLSVTSGPGK